MKKLFASFLPWVLPGALALWVAGGLRPPRDQDGFHAAAFGRTPALLNGRVQPLDSVGRNALLIMRGRRAVSYRERDDQGRLKRRRLNATEWLMETLMAPQRADTRPVFRVDHPDLKDLLGLPAEASAHFFSWNDLKAKFPAIEREARRARGVEARQRTAFDNAVVKLHQGLILFQRLKNSLKPENVDDFAAEFARFQKDVVPGLEAYRKSQAGESFDQAALTRFGRLLRRYESQGELAYPFLIPPADPGKDPAGWQTVPAAVLEPVRRAIGAVSHGGDEPISLKWPPEVADYAALATAFARGEPEAFNAALADLRQRLRTALPRAVAKGEWEFLYNQWKPFYRSIAIYFLAFLLGCFSWIGWFRGLNRGAFYLLLLGFGVHTAGIIFRMALEGRPPVTNLYSSAVFVGWGAVLLGLFLEYSFRNSLGIVMSAAVGTVTQIVAYNLSLRGDTMEMMRAVLDSNFWLTTHVLTITIGYSAMFAAGMLAIIYIVMGVFTRLLTPAHRKAIEGMVFGTVCFATLFSFVGTVTGGVWADQSWGRFWGWDPKENGALFIVLWCAVILHARCAHLVAGRGMMSLAIGGNIVTSLSWFGVNMLGVGLHSYGFMNSAFRWLMIFIASQLALIALGLVPTRYWRSHREAAPPRETVADPG
jgi:ABC-type transport system involved in cytochrome c biogenesis permease subunit